MARQESVLERINTELEEGWEAKLNPDGRIYYVNHKTQTTSWLPPRENWASTTGLPYGWETGVDRNDKDYYINHVDRFTTRDDPRLDPDYVEPPKPREVELRRDPEKGFGFVAGSEKPVVVRFVTEGGPSESQLLPGDQILKINGEEVRRAPREKVIELVRSCKESIVLTVCQPYTDNSNRKSALLTAAKKAKLKNNPSRVRFADAVMVNGASVHPSPVESYVPFMPNVLKVFLENGQTKSFKYDNKTTVKDVVVSLQEKLNIRCVHHFSLVLQNMKNNTGTAAKMTLLQEQETLADIAARPGARYFRCLFRVTFVPKDAYDLLKEDPIAFEYFYLQCCNDVLHERFASEMKYDTALRLAALQIQQHAMSNNMSAKISIKAVVKECGLDKFVSKSLMESMKGKDLKRMLAQYLKMNQSLAAPGQKQLTALQAKLHYMKIVSELKTFGSRVFMVTLLDKRTEAMLLVGPHSGVSIVTNIKSYALTQLADFEHIEQVKVTKDGENMHRVDLKLKGQRAEVISLGLLSEDAQNFVCMVAGYYKIFVDPDKRIVERTIGKNTSDPDVPSYESVHRVQAAPWSYPEDLVSEVVVTSEDDVSGGTRRVDLAQDPPEYVENKEYIAKVKQDLGIEQTQKQYAVSHLDRPINVSTIKVSPAMPQKAKVNGGPTPFEEGVTSFGTASSDSSSRSSSLSSQGNSATLAGTVPSLGTQPVYNATIDLRRKLPANGHAASGASGIDSERSSDTDSQLSSADAERRPLLSGAGVGGVGAQQNGEVRGEGESDESDSFGTPSDSPAKAKLIQRVSSIESGMHSFGLHSPDMLPAADVDFQHMGAGDLNALPPEVYNAIYNPESAIPPQKLYFDPDIIDLTIFPMADAPEDESMIDFTSLPPPSFANNPPSVFTSENATSAAVTDFTGPYGPAVPSGSTHRLERSASTGHCPDFFDTDIDSIIAQYYVPPPPSSSDDNDSIQAQVLSQSFSGVMPRDSSSHPPTTLDLGDDFSSLIIPPPPSSTQVEEEAPVVPPAPAPERRKKFRHKRSSSVDIGSLNAAKKQLEEAEKRRSLDVQQQHSVAGEAGDDSPRPHGQHGAGSPPHSLGVGGQFDSDMHDGLAAESPATVSLKLHNLLKSLPTIAPEVAMNNPQQPQPFYRTGSLRIPRSASWDVVPGPNAPVNGDMSQTMFGVPQQRALFSGTSSMSRITGRRAVSQERLFSQNVAMYGVNGTHMSGGSEGGKDSEEQKSASESFASLKAKLKDYRDSLLKRASGSRKSSTSEDSDSLDGEKKKSSLKRSSSFRGLLAQLSGRRSSKNSDPVVVGDGNWTLRSKASDASPSHSASNLANLFIPPGSEGEEAGGEKRPPTVRETFVVPRSSLRPVSNAGGNQPDVKTDDDAGEDSLLQSKSKKSGPLKALSSVFSSEEKGSDESKLDGYHPHRPLQASQSAPARTSKKSASKDDLSVTRKKDKNKVKANPYATIKMWRPITMTSSVSHDEDVYRNFADFDTPIGEAKLPATGDLRNEDFLSGFTGMQNTSTGVVSNSSFGEQSLRENSRPNGREFSVNDGSPRAHSVLSSQPSNQSSVWSAGSFDHNGLESEDTSMTSRRDSRKSRTSEVSGRGGGRRSPVVMTEPLIPRTVNVEEDAVIQAPPRRSRQISRTASGPPAPAMNGDLDVPADYPQQPSPSLNSLRARSVSPGGRERGDSSERRGRTISESSFAVVSNEVAASVKGMLSKTYGPEGFEAATHDVEVLLTQLKSTMESLKAAQARVSSSNSQFQTVRQELQLQTKQFVQDAKCLVTAATGDRQTIARHLHDAMHTLARLFLHSQATMVRMRSVHQAQHVGFEVLKVSASFKSTVAAANAAIGKPTTDPHMKYLMRQATNLAGLLSTLLKTLKNLEQN